MLYIYLNCSTVKSVLRSHSCYRPWPHLSLCIAHFNEIEPVTKDHLTSETSWWQEWGGLLRKVLLHNVARNTFQYGIAHQRYYSYYLNAMCRSKLAWCLTLEVVGYEPWSSDLFLGSPDAAERGSFRQLPCITGDARWSNMSCGSG